MIRAMWMQCRWLADDEGQDLLEYGLLVSLIALIVMVGATAVGDTIKTVLWEFIASNDF